MTKPCDGSGQRESRLMPRKTFKFPEFKNTLIEHKQYPDKYCEGMPEIPN